MIESKARGSESTYKTSFAILGQQFINAERPAKASSYGMRWLNTFHVEDESIYSRGFAKNSYFSGLDPNETFAHAQSSRISLIESALKTAETGALERKMVKAQEDLIAEYDGTVRNHNGIITQFIYGSGFSSTEMVNSYSGTGKMKKSFINMAELVSNVNMENGFSDFNLMNNITEIFEKINEKYGEKLMLEENDGVINSETLPDDMETLTLQDDDMDENEDFDI